MTVFVVPGLDDRQPARRCLSESMVSTAVAAHNLINLNVTLPIQLLCYLNVRDATATRVKGYYRLPFPDDLLIPPHRSRISLPVLEDRLVKATNAGQTKPVIDTAPTLKVWGMWK